jgi:predicted RNase H-like nuclease
MAKAEKRLAVGVDGVKGGAWVAVALRGRRVAGTAVLSRLVDVIDRWPEAEAIGVDIPIGLPPPFPRRADVGARELLKPVIARVFATHAREVYEASTHAEATVVATAVDGEGISQQA